MSKSLLPGLIAAGLMILITCLWTFWGVAEMYYEGWGNPFPIPVFYLVPAAICLSLTVLALLWPRLGGWIIVIVGSVFSALILGPRVANGRAPLTALLSWMPVTLLVVLVGTMFIWEGRRRRKIEDVSPRERRWRRGAVALALVAPLLVAAGVSAYYLPIVLARVDDGDRGPRRIDGNGVSLIWAPAGPGWNWKQPFGGYPAWNSLALYGVEPVGLEGKARKPDGSNASEQDMMTTGLCRYLDESGSTLTPEPQNIWRMPTTDEIARSLVLHGQNAGCVWNGEPGRLDCAIKGRPDKETPLWAPDQPPIYYWSGDELDENQAFYVSYNGHVGVQPKSWGNPRHGYRCVRNP
ncbi:MAG: DUF1566 domain-containing protein [Chloroflexi bacterium]|nr:DUF1566 domain-containing protein [Chloroflexota bacterium]